MAKSDLLKQAIADANAVKETALANAKIALQEAFRPRLESMFADKLSEELDDEELPADDMPIDGEEMGDEELPVDDFESPESVGVGLDFNNDGDYDLSGTVGADVEDEDEFSDEENLGSDEDAASEYGESDDDLNLEGILRELEQDLENVPAGDEADLAEGDDLMHGDLDADGNPVEDDALDEDIDSIIEAILREEDLDAEGDIHSDDEHGDVANLKNEVAEKEEELQEAYKTVRKLNSIINEVNLLNAKLLYTNKLFRNFELNETQKMKVIENFDRAGNTREVKLVFSTLAESFNRPQTKKKMVKESYASKPVRTTAPSKPILNEGFELAERWKKLAGLL
jgi:hypothetical protein